jgi:hypothetical protein
MKFSTSEFSHVFPVLRKFIADVSLSQYSLKKSSAASILAISELESFCLSNIFLAFACATSHNKSFDNCKTTLLYKSIIDTFDAKNVDKTNLPAPGLFLN